jgi:hypothetical protein
MACVNQHNVTTKAQGPGKCCAAYSAAFGAGHIPQIGERVSALDAKGHCFVCEVKASTSKKHAGRPVFKRGLSQVIGSTVSCPTTTQGCCALTGA